ncbi:RusA family crossover junction endodeoxyribonuclease [Sinorhizobium mexicanum]|uniref:RusA family crossover junction endodeoxyribonuclease n=1 Tax=Sinorhizobium mexicanum TaxID=375549 RepID=A0A859QLM1_9HYPH|nr:RusA family crossover junction endodeoxyribonuclease [Sinorhizobium mexicanum]MBP1885715.1 Holliday junction resolvase RusA-like endonuclease [Sinorhizobium mexicanum]QLL63480.1 RusA family crossover junction endodeoxyribonuclease [Sinorhizobium mexicanum]
MLPFEFTIQGPPVSNQTRNRARLQQWKQEVGLAAQARIPAGIGPVPDPVQITITYYYEGDSPDVDNIIKPIQDALNGLVFVDDAQVAETKSRKRPLDGSYQIKGASGVLLQGFAAGVGFLHVRIESNTHNGVLDS